MITSHSRRTELSVRSDDCFEEIDLGAARRWVDACNAAGLHDSAVVGITVHGDAMRHLVAEQVTYEQLDVPGGETR